MSISKSPIEGVSAPLTQRLLRQAASRVSLGLVAIAATVALAMSLGVLRPLEDGLAALRFTLLERPASGEITVVTIDAKSLRAAGRWPWDRERYATVIRNLNAAGADIIGFDVDFSASSSASGDAALAQAIASRPGAVVLPTFVQPASDLGEASHFVRTSPLASLSTDALLASVNVPVDDDGRVRRYQFGFSDGEAYRPSVAAMLAGAPYGKTGGFLIDYSVSASDIPRISLQDVYDNRFDKAAVKGRAILVGATALELGDEFATQQAGTLSGVFVHALAYESIRAGRALVAPHPLLMFGLAGLLAFALRPTRRDAAAGTCVRRHLVAGGLLIIAPMVIQAFTPLSLPIAPLLLAQSLCVVWAARTELNRRAQAIVREREAGLLHLATHDAETELPNRRALVSDIARRLNEKSGATAVLAVGLERYALMRGVLGYGIANLTVREIAARLGSACPDATVAHLSTSVLGVVVTQADAEQLATAVGELEDLPPRCIIEGHPIDVFLKLGVVYAPADRTSDPEQLLERASTALDEARSLNRSIAIFDERTDVDRSQNLALMSEMSLGLNAGDLSLHYQPKASVSSGDIVGVEALVRWRHPERGNIPPDAFIGTAEETGAIRELTEWTLSRAVADSRRLRSIGYDLVISVNISGRLLAEPHFCDRVLSLVRSDGPAICLEITETAVIDNPESAMAAIAKFHAAGLKVSIDDYGVGLSSLSYLKMLDADELKVDKSLVVEVGASQRDRLILKSTIDLAHSLGMVVVAEGVETAEVQAALSLLGCDLVQGYLISKPLPLEELEAYLERHYASSVQPAHTHAVSQARA